MKPLIPIDTQREMWKFFMKTSVPRLLEKERKKKELEKLKGKNE